MNKLNDNIKKARPMSIAKAIFFNSSLYSSIYVYLESKSFKDSCGLFPSKVSYTSFAMGRYKS